MTRKKDEAMRGNKIVPQLTMMGLADIASPGFSSENTQCCSSHLTKPLPAHISQELLVLGIYHILFNTNLKTTFFWVIIRTHSIFLCHNPDSKNINWGLG